jgi:hypothetical protein
VAVTGRGQGEALSDDGPRSEADQQLVHQPAEAALEAFRGHAVRAHGGRHRRRIILWDDALLRHRHDRAVRHAHNQSGVCHGQWLI